ncbi:galanin receptor type 1-like [Patiria miniata]|uniref:G-protein coupled receptors family 1 profile domain-containing protein n=1 Tax=Patiria miniata TaxID=46514 RepID=A0A914BFJ5_PATMI|nr:galanin receptor type 1-like [Patiria miniata]
MISSHVVPDDVPLHLATKIVFSIIAALGIAGNGLVIYVLASAVASRRGNINILLINQSLIDLITSILLVLCFLTPGQRPPSPTPAAAAFICYIWNSKYLFWATTMASMVNLLLLTFERYYATLYPLQYCNRSFLKWPRSLALATLPWILGYLLEIYTVLGHTVDKHNQCKLKHFPTWSVKIIYSVAVLVFDYLVPLGLMVFAYVRIYRALRGNTAASGDSPNERTPIVQPANQHGESASRSLARRNVIKTLVTVCGVFCLLWLPNQFAYFYYNISDEVHLNMDLYGASIIFAFLNMCVNPFIYTFQYHQFREGLGRAIPCLARFRIMRIPETRNNLAPA